MSGLDIWLYGDMIGRLTSARTDHLAFESMSAAIERWGPGSNILSVAVPLRAEVKVPTDRLRAFFNGLLPEGAAREELARRFNLRPRDVIGLLRELGEDCAGAVMAVPAGELPPQRPERYKMLTDADLAELMHNLPSAPLGLGDGPVTRKSLAGVQPKLLVTKRPSGEWAYSTDGAPSTHILKPEEADYPGGASNEAWCMRLAKKCGLTTVDADVLQIGDLPVYAVSRYDRVTDGDQVGRIHQEDFCQALGIETFDPRAKYGSHNAKRLNLRAMAEVLRFYAPGERTRLLAMTTFHVAIGNADAHGKNYSILHHPDGAIDLAPVYDAWSTIQYPRLSRTLSLSIDRTFQLDAVSVARLVAEAASWGLNAVAAETVVHQTLDVLAAELDDASHRVDLQISDEFVGSIKRRVGELRR
jgi:serine/threonine-protein kinase HipA